MQFKRQVKAEEGVNLTPLIDVVFLLLIFFMVSTTFTKETHLAVDLPEANGKKQEQPAETIEVVINASGDYFINGSALVNQKIETLRAAIEAESNGERDLPFFITGDANAAYQRIVTVMDLAGQMGFQKLRMTTQKTTEEAD